MYAFMLFVCMSLAFTLGIMYLYWHSLEKPEDSFTSWLKVLVKHHVEETYEARRDSGVTRTRDLPEYREEVTAEESRVSDDEREAEIAALEELFNREERS